MAERTLCACGCGGTPNPGCRFLYQHHNRMIKTRFPGVCACGCGAATAAGRRFRHGHWARTDRSWWREGPLTPEHRAKISAATKGRPLAKPRTPEHIAKIAEAKRGKPNVIRDRESWIAKGRAAKLGKKRAPFSEEWRAKIGAGIRGKPAARTPANLKKWEGLAKIAQAIRADPAWIERNREHLQRVRPKRQPSGLERTVAAILDALGIAYQPQAPLGWYHVDFLLLEQRVVLECDGTYWHGRPQQIEDDRRRDAWLNRHGYTVVRLKEADIRRDAKGLIEEMLQTHKICSKD